MGLQELTEKFDKVYIDRGEEDSSLARRAREVFPNGKIEVIDTLPLTPGELSPSEFSRSKRLLHLTRFKGRFFKRCPGSRPGLSCCNYFVLNWGLQCDMNCSYCYLQSFINTPMLTLYTNIEEALSELQELAQGDLGRQTVRIGTGETVDSLSLDELTLHSHRLIAFFRETPSWTLEFKTKSNKVEQFLDVEHAGNVIVSWSVNPQWIVEREEHGTASLEQRLTAAERCLHRGFKIGFHIDPMIWHSEWRENYASLVDEIDRRFTPAQIPYLSVGALRFQPEQKAMMRERFGMKSYVTQAETFIGQDGKRRYDAGIRQEMFQFVMNRFREKNPDWRIFMCMETPETWLKTVGQSPFREESLHDLFDPGVLRAARSAKSKV